MIAPAREKPVETAPQAGPASVPLLPSFGRLLSVASFANLPVLAVLLIAGSVRIALSQLAGFAISILVCALLYVMVGKCMAYYVASIGGKGGSAANGGAMVQMAALLVAKFLVLGLAAYAVMSVRGLNLLAVLIGFLLTHFAIIMAATTHLKKR